MTIGILLVNLGTPDAPTTQAVRKYLTEFLLDKRVVELPSILVKLIILLRARKSAKLYQKIWAPQGSPLRIYMEKITQKLSQQYLIAYGMRYGNPSIQEAMEKLRAQKINKLLILPLYPQYSATTTATTFDKVAEILKTWRYQPELRMINAYYDHPAYIEAIANSLGKLNTQKLLFSFHGLPKLFIEKGDPYEQHCKITAELIAKKLNLLGAQWDISFQSRLGKAEWLKPYTSNILASYPKENINSVTVICPGFSVDCLETLEEINMQNREIFLEAGGKEFNYIPALNSSEAQINLLEKLIGEHLWVRS